MTRRTRRRVLSGLAGLSTVAAAGCVGRLRPSAGGCEPGLTTGDAEVGGVSESWPQFQNDARNTGYGADATGPETGAALAWRATCRPVGSGTTPVVDGDRGTIYAGHANVSAFDLATGEREWRSDASGTATAPALAGGRLYVAGRDLRAVDPADGSVVWTFEIPTEYPVSSPPAVADGTVYVGGGIGTPRAYAVDAADGSLVWERELAGESLTAAPAVGGGTVYFVDDENRLVALDAAAGDERWRAPDTWALDAGAVAADGRVYVRDSPDAVYALSTDGDVEWEAPLDGANGGPVATDGEAVYAAHGSRVSALDAGDGSERWTYDVPVDGVRGLGTPVAAGRTVYVGTRGFRGEDGPRGLLLAVDATTGDERWRFVTPAADSEGGIRGGTVAGPAVAGGVLFAATGTGDLYALAEPDG